MKDIVDIKDVIMSIAESCDELLYSNVLDGEFAYYNYGVKDTQSRITDIIKKGKFTTSQQETANRQRLDLLNQIINKLITGDNVLYDICYGRVEKRKIIDLKVYYGINNEINFKINCGDKFLITDLEIGKTIFLNRNTAKMKLREIQKREW